MTEVPITQLGAMRDAKQCVVLVRGLEDDIELKVSRQQFREVLESLDDDGASWTVLLEGGNRNCSFGTVRVL